jgi:hypothetical protein
MSSFVKKLPVHEVLLRVIPMINTSESFYLVVRIILEVDIKEGHDEILEALEAKCLEKGLGDRDPALDTMGVRKALFTKKAEQNEFF